MHVANKLLKQYTGGVFEDPNCTGNINHAALIVGYNLKGEKPYFEMKNAWGERWGDHGYYKFAIGPLSYQNDGQCRLLNNTSAIVIEAVR